MRLHWFHKCCITWPYWYLYIYICLYIKIYIIHIGIYICKHSMLLQRLQQRREFHFNTQINSYCNTLSTFRGKSLPPFSFLSWILHNVLQIPANLDMVLWDYIGSWWSELMMVRADEWILQAGKKDIKAMNSPYHSNTSSVYIVIWIWISYRYFSNKTISLETEEE